MHITFTVLSLLALLTPYYTSTSDEPHEIDQQLHIFPFRLGEHRFNETIELIHREYLRKKSLPLNNSLNLMTENKMLLTKAQQLYLEVQQDNDVRESFAHAAQSSLKSEALREWVAACHIVNRILNLKTKELQQTNTEITEAELHDIHFLTHFAFQQNKYLIERDSCEKANRKPRSHKWFVNTHKKIKVLRNQDQFLNKNSINLEPHSS